MHTERLVNGTAVFVDGAYRFGQDAMLLSAFCKVRRAERVCDLGTGCGIIPLRWHDRGHRGPCYAVELQAGALALLQQALAEGRIEHIVPVLGDLHSWRPREAGLFDVVCCNPPYFTGGRQSPDPARADMRHERTCTLADVCHTASALLRDGGRLCVCQRPERLADAIAAMRAVRIEPKRLQFVAARPDREPVLFLLEGHKNRAPGMRVAPVFITQREDRSPSDEILAVYSQTREEKP